jgi:hypothetical protein
MPFINVNLNTDTRGGIKKSSCLCQRYPFNFEVLGSFLHSKIKEEWDSALAKLMEVPNAEIQISKCVEIEL